MAAREEEGLERKEYRKIRSSSDDPIYLYDDFLQESLDELKVQLQSPFNSGVTCSPRTSSQDSA